MNKAKIATIFGENRILNFIFTHLNSVKLTGATAARASCIHSADKLTVPLY